MHIVPGSRPIDVCRPTLVWHIPENTRRSPKFILMLGQRRRRWNNNKLKLFLYLVFTGYIYTATVILISWMWWINGGVGLPLGLYCNAEPKGSNCLLKSKQLLPFGFVRQYIHLSFKYSSVEIRIFPRKARYSWGRRPTASLCQDLLLGRWRFVTLNILIYRSDFAQAHCWVCISFNG